jgi:hypothetical protein
MWCCGRVSSGLHLDVNQIWLKGSSSLRLALTLESSTFYNVNNRAIARGPDLLDELLALAARVGEPCRHRPVLI